MNENVTTVNSHIPPRRFYDDPIVLLKLRRRMLVAWVLYVPFLIWMLCIWGGSRGNAEGIGVWPGLHLESEDGRLYAEAVLSRKSWEPGSYGRANYDYWPDHLYFRSLNLTLFRTGIFIGRRPVRSFHSDNRSGMWDYEKVVMIGVPHWMIILAAGILPYRFTKDASLLTRRFQRRRELLSASLYCRECGYDLRATPTRCPECGTIVVRVAHVRRPCRETSSRFT